MKTLLALTLALVPAPALAREAFVGVLAHGVETPLSLDAGEGGVSIQAGVRGGRIAALNAIGGPQPYLFGSLNTRGDTSFVAAGLAWTIGKGPVYVRPGIGVAVHDGPSRRVVGGFRTDLGSRVLFAPELGIGYRIGRGVSVEAQWTHLSHAQLFGGQNPGLDMIGARVNLGF